MPVLRCYVDDRTLATLERISALSGRSVEDLAEAAIAEEAIRAQHSRFAAQDLARAADRQLPLRHRCDCFANGIAPEFCRHS